jgi:hypothetical protein
MQIIDGTLISFDTTKVKINELILEYFCEDNIQDVINNNNNEFIYGSLYDLQKTTKFKDMHSSLLNQISNHLNERNFYYQSIPSFRIHRINRKVTNYHNDVMYGHGEKVINVWLPLNDTNKNNSLFISDLKTSKMLLKKIEDLKLSLSQINDLLKSNCSPKLVRYGQMLLFNTMTMHGTEINTSKEHRLSFDFRLLPYAANSGSKSISDFYSSYISLNKKTKKTPCTYYLHTNNPLMKNFSHSVQREIINRYSKENNLILEGIEENEIYGVNHYPVIFHYLNDKKTNDIVMASILCLPSESNLRAEVLLSAKKNNVKLHYCMENKVSSHFSIEDSNNYYELLLKADKSL